MRVLRWFLAAAVGAALALPAAGVPSFARRYETSCATCHQAFPRLNAVGESFRLMGFRFVDDARYRKTQPVEMGDEAYKRLWPRALWPSDVPRTSPLSFITRLMLEADLDGSRPTAVTYLLPEEAELVWAGNLGEDILFYGDVIFLQKDFGGLEPESWATIKGWLQFQSLLGPDHRLNLRAGSVGTQTMGLFTARDANFYGTHFYLYTSWLMPPVELAAAGLSEFKGNNFTIGPQAGVELNGVGKRWFWATGLVNGDLETPIGQPPPQDVSFYGQGAGRHKDVYVQLAWKLGGIAWDRSGEQPAESLASATEFWRDDSLVLSLFGYRGTADVRTVDLAGTETVVEDDFWRLAVGLEQHLRDLTLGVAYMAGEDERPYGSLTDQGVDSRTFHVEALYFVYPWLIPFLRYESLELDMPVGVAGIGEQQDMARVLAGAKMLIRPNVSFTAEYSYFTEGAELEEGFDQTLFVLLAASF